MILKNISLENFRNHSKKSISFGKNTTIIVGANASGKTNILEAIFFLALGKSFKAERGIDAISFDGEIARIKGNIKKSSNREIGQSSFKETINILDNQLEKDVDEKVELEVILTRGEVSKITTPLKKFLVNGVAKRSVDFAGNLKAVLFWPQDLDLVTDSPSLRRRYLDFVLMQVDREYRRTLISFERGLRQRNRLLEAIREQGVNRSQLLFWDQLLIKSGDYITKKREEYIDFINKFDGMNSSKISITNYQIIYDKSIISRQRLDQYKEEEVASGVTLVGPHRDNFIFRIKNYESRIKNTEEYRHLADFGSRGEQRLAILWLKLGELSYIEMSAGEKPILLLDDILSELDHEHREIIFNILGFQQTIMTTTDFHFLPQSVRNKSQVIELGMEKNNEQGIINNK